MLVQVCALLWCETKGQGVCQLQQLERPHYYSDVLPIEELDEMPSPFSEKEYYLEKNLGCWMQRKKKD